MSVVIRIAGPDVTGLRWYIFVVDPTAPPSYHTMSYMGTTLQDAVQLLRKRTALYRRVKRTLWKMRET